jgi:3-hydroxyacyl-CoA dehydrogenase
MTMSPTSQFSDGTGVIGACWAAEFLARGLDVVATDPAPKAETNLREYIDEAWKDLTSIGLSKGASRDRTPNITPELTQKVINGVMGKLPGARSINSLKRKTEC